MGQPVAVAVKPSSTPGIVRFELNRNLGGMGHDRYTGGTDVVGDRPSAELARRLFATGKVDRVHVYLNMVTVDLRKGMDAAGLEEIIESLYTYYVPGFVPPPLVMPEEPVAAAPAGGEVPAGGNPALSRVPAALLERSAAAKARWFAKKNGE
jgi:hypothetical protein